VPQQLVAAVVEHDGFACHGAKAGHAIHHPLWHIAAMKE
jgi:hypothetical protein